MRDLLVSRKRSCTEAPALFKAMEAEYAKKTPEAANWLPALAETARLLGLEDQERRYLEKLSESKTPEIQFRLADLHVERKRPGKEAAEIYRQMWEDAGENAIRWLCRFTGWAATQSGQEKEGRPTERYHCNLLLPLGARRRHSTLAEV